MIHTTFLCHHHVDQSKHSYTLFDEASCAVQYLLIPSEYIIKHLDSRIFYIEVTTWVYDHMIHITSDNVEQ